VKINPETCRDCLTKINGRTLSTGIEGLDDILAGGPAEQGFV